MHGYTYLCICLVAVTVKVVSANRPAPNENGIERYFLLCSKKSHLMGSREVFGKMAKLLAEVLVSEGAPYIHLLQRLFHF